MIAWLRTLAAPRRTSQTNLELGAFLAGVAGAINAGGFLAVGRYTSHMTGILSSLVDNLALGNIMPVLEGFGAIFAFILGTITTTLLVNWARRRHLHSLFALPLLLEALCLLLFGLTGSRLEDHTAFRLPLDLLLLVYLMGVQNSVITKISRSEIRTTHVTGLITDLGIEIGRMLYNNRSIHLKQVQADRRKLRIQLTLITSFATGGLLGALGFSHLGNITTVPLAILLVTLASTPLLDDFRLLWRHRQRT